MNDDFLDLLRELTKSEARFIVVGAYAMAVHGTPRSTGDIDIWIEPTAINAQRVWQALGEFGVPLDAPGVTQVDLETPGMVVQVGLPPRRIDLLTQITAVSFAHVWPRREIRTVGDIDVPFLDRDSLLVNKRQTGRAKDLADVELLEAGARPPTKDGLEG